MLQLLICGDLRGNLVLFPLLKDLLLNTFVMSAAKISPISHFKGAHGISTVSSISVTHMSFNHIELCSVRPLVSASLLRQTYLYMIPWEWCLLGHFTLNDAHFLWFQTGADGCICYMEYDKGLQSLNFVGMKQVKELSMIESVSTDNESTSDRTSGSYASGFASTDFIIWNLVTEAKVLFLFSSLFICFICFLLFLLIFSCSGHQVDICFDFLQYDWNRSCKFHAAVGGVHILIIWVMYQR